MKWKITSIVLAVGFVSLLAHANRTIAQQRDRIADLESSVDRQRDTIDELTRFALSKVYLDRLLTGQSRAKAAPFTTREAMAAALLEDAFLAQVALSADMPDQNRYALMIYAFSAYESLMANPFLRPERFPIPKLEWETIDGLEEGFEKGELRRFCGPGFTRFLWIGRGPKPDAITGASLDVPELKEWRSYESFKASLDAYRLRPTGLAARQARLLRRP